MILCFTELLDKSEYKPVECIIEMFNNNTNWMMNLNTELNLLYHSVINYFSIILHNQSSAQTIEMIDVLLRKRYEAPYKIEFGCPNDEVEYSNKALKYIKRMSVTQLGSFQLFSNEEKTSTFAIAKQNFDENVNIFIMHGKIISREEIDVSGFPINLFRLNDILYFITNGSIVFQRSYMSNTHLKIVKSGPTSVYCFLKTRIKIKRGEELTLPHDW